jgi:hypothetical protein
MNNENNKRAIYQLNGSRTFCGSVQDIQDAIERGKSRRGGLDNNDEGKDLHQREFEMLASLYTNLEPFVATGEDDKKLRVMFKVSLIIEPSIHQPSRLQRCLSSTR